MGYGMKRQAFTLIELLVVVAIIAMLISILLPSMSRARALAKVKVCASNLRQLGIGITTYANMYHGSIPVGPTGDNMSGLPYTKMGTNQMWLGNDQTGKPDAPSHTYVGAGILLKTKTEVPEALFCPADSTEDVTDDGDKVGTDEDAYCSYLYRQLDTLPGGTIRGRLGDLGTNDCKRADGSTLKVPVQALALDVSSYGQGQMQHLTHEGKTVNVLYEDMSVRDHENHTVTGTQPYAADGPGGTGRRSDLLRCTWTGR